MKRITVVAASAIVGAALGAAAALSVSTEVNTAAIAPAPRPQHCSSVSLQELLKEYGMDSALRQALDQVDSDQRFQRCISP